MQYGAHVCIPALRYAMICFSSRSPLCTNRDTFLNMWCYLCLSLIPLFKRDKRECVSCCVSLLACLYLALPGAPWCPYCCDDCSVSGRGIAPGVRYANTSFLSLHSMNPRRVGLCKETRPASQPNHVHS